MNLAVLVLAASQAAYNSGTISKITPEFVADFKKSELCSDAPVEALSVHSGELAIYVVKRDGQIEVMQDGFARRFQLDYCQ
jgi:hypothetical protein